MKPWKKREPGEKAQNNAVNMSAEKSGEDSGRRNRRKRRVRNRILAWGLVACLAVAIAFLGFRIFAAVGYNSLRNSAAASRPSLGLEVGETWADNGTETLHSTEEEDVLPSSGGLTEKDGTAEDNEPAEEAEVISVPWEPDWVQYGGKIYDYNEDILTFLFLGIDKEEAVGQNPDLVSGGQSDAVFLAVLNPDTKKISLIGVNRDTMVEIRMVGIGPNGEDMYTTAELAVQHGFGDGLHQSCELTRDAVSKLFYGLPIHGYVSFNMGGVGALNDALGGVRLNVLEDMTKVNPVWTQGAEITLTGLDAYTYIRYRDTTVFESARNRLARQKQYLSGAAAAALEGTKKNPALPLTLYQAFQPYIVTDLSADKITYLASVIAGYQFDGEAIYTLQGNTVTGEMFEEFYPDKKALKELILRLFYREIDSLTGRPVK